MKYNETSVNERLEQILSHHNKWEFNTTIKQEDGLCHGNMGIFVMCSEVFENELRKSQQEFCYFRYLQKNENLGFMIGCVGTGYYF